MVARQRAQIWLQLLLVRMMPYLPGKDLVVRKIKQQVQEAANAVQIKDY